MPPRNPPVKLYYRIGEVAQAVGVQPHVLRYWESEFGSIRPQKSARGQRVYSHKDLEKLIRVKELLHTDGYTIAGARKKLREPVSAADAASAAEVATAAAVSPAAETSPAAVHVGADEVTAKMRAELSAIRSEIQAQLDLLDQQG